MSKYFSYEEFERSETAKKLGIDNTIPNNAIKSNIDYLCNYLLDKLRSIYNRPIYINSGYRSVALNIAVKGSTNSAHTTGLAADIDTRCGENRRLADIVVMNRLPFRQMILYSSLENPKWIHLGISRIENCGQIMLKKDGKYIDITGKYKIKI